MERRVQGRDLELAGRVLVTMPAMLLSPLWPDLAAFADRYPSIDVCVAGSFAYADLTQREADVALRLTQQPSPELVGRRLGTAAVGIYGSAAYLATRPRKVRLEQLDFIGWTSPDIVFSRWLRDHVPKARIRSRVGLDAQLEAAVNAGVGVSLMLCALGDSHPDWRRVQLVPELTLPVWILSHKDLRTTVRMRVLRDHLAEVVTAKRDLIEGRAPVRA